MCRREELLVVAVFLASSAEERMVHLGVVEARHWTTVESQRPGRNDHIGALQAGIALGRNLRQIRSSGEKAGHLRIMRKQFRHLVVEAHVVTNDGRHRRFHRLFDVARRKRRQKPLFGFRSAQEQEARRRYVGAGRAPLHQVVQLSKSVVTDGFVQPRAMCARLAEDLIKRFVAERRMHIADLRFGSDRHGIFGEKRLRSSERSRINVVYTCSVSWPFCQLQGQSSSVWSASSTRRTSCGFRPTERSVTYTKRITLSGSTM